MWCGVVAATTRERCTAIGQAAEEDDANARRQERAATASAKRSSAAAMAAAAQRRRAVLLCVRVPFVVLLSRGEQSITLVVSSVVSHRSGRRSIAARRTAHSSLHRSALPRPTPLLPSPHHRHGIRRRAQVGRTARAGQQQQQRRRGRRPCVLVCSVAVGRRCPSCSSAGCVRRRRCGAACSGDVVASHRHGQMEERSGEARRGHTARRKLLIRGADSACCAVCCSVCVG